MKRLYFACVSAVLVVGCVAAQRSIAQDSAALLDHYRVVPQQSTLHQTGGFAGFDLRYRLLGDYGFRRGTSSTAATTASAKFVDAEIWGSIISDGPTPAYVIDVDQILNLEGLQGKLLPTASVFSIYQFQGKTSDGSAVNLYASMLGPWMYLRGGTQPPAGSADYFVYQLKALARKGPFADLNGDSVVDASDYALLRKSGVAGGSEATSGASFTDWRQQFGETVPDLTAMDAAINSASGSNVTISSVPEPACLGLAIAAGFFALGTRRKCERG